MASCRRKCDVRTHKHTHKVIITVYAPISRRSFPSLSSPSNSFSPLSQILLPSSLSSSRQCWLHPDPFDTQVKPWLYLVLSLLGFLANGLTLREFRSSGRTPTVILTLNMVTSDLLLCTSFLFRVVYYRRGHIWSGEDKACQAAMLTGITVFYVNLYCNMMLLLWTSVTRYATVVWMPTTTSLQT